MASMNSLAGLATKFSRLSTGVAAPALSQLHLLQCLHTQQSPLLFHATTQLCAAPMKRKKKTDPALLIQRENKKKRNLEKQVKRLERQGRLFKPIDEIDHNPKLVAQVGMRKRETTVLTFDEGERRALMHKQWTRYKFGQLVKENAAIASLTAAQERALAELKFESEELYNQAVRLDETLLHFEMKGPTATPPIKDYSSPDGDYTDTTKTFE